jgi:uncharacterized membrane protein
MDLARIFRHLLLPDVWLRRGLTRGVLDAITHAIAQSERLHHGELRFAVEATLPLGALLRDQSVRERALEVFSDLRVWDTEHNSGVLIYIQLADRDVEIVADRGISARVAQAEWDAICRQLEAHFREGAFERGALTAVDATTVLLQRHFPASGANLDELPDRPAILG